MANPHRSTDAAGFRTDCDYFWYRSEPFGTGGSFGATRKLRKSKDVKGTTLREMRVLGPYLPAEQGLAGEIMRRIQAGTKAWRQCGVFWSSRTPRPIKRLMFQAFVIGGVLSGLTCFVLEKRHTDKLDALLAKYLRVLSAGKHSWVNEQGEQFSALHALGEAV